MRRLLCGVCFALIAAPGNAQFPDAAGAGARTTAAGATRTSSGAPGPGYWQQRVDYDITATLDPRANQITGSARITYHNNSPDTLQQLWWHIYQNIFRERGLTRGLSVESITIGGAAVTPELHGTLMRTPLPVPLLPRTNANIDVRWSYQPAPSASLRSGREGDDFAVAQWYPQIATYDDVRGWDATPYRGYEYYLEYGNWDVQLTVPAAYVIAATGTLRNAEQVLTQAQQQRLAGVRAQDVTQIITRADTSALATGTRTWRFTAQDVRDFVWAASPAFVWDATRTKPLPDQPQGVLVHAFYQPREADNWGEALPAAVHALEYFSARFGAYAYPQASLVSGPARGMEYPMLVFLSSGDPATNQLAAVTVHELAHEWYPMMIGSNETAHPWMDEGFATYLEAAAMDDRLGYANLLQRDAPSLLRAIMPALNARRVYQHVYLSAVRAGEDPVLMMHPHQMTREYGVAAYQKPGTVLFMLEDMLGRDMMDRVLQEYYRRWRFRHPWPDDFFNTVEDVSGHDLDWFWNQWFVQKWALDMAVDDVDQVRNADGWSARITIDNRAPARMPVLLRLTLDDGSTRDMRVPITVWRDDARRHTVSVSALPSKIASAELDPDDMLADVDRMNNRWPRPHIDVSLKPHLLMDVGGPIDAYSVSVWPRFGGSSQDGMRLGASVVGSYLGDQQRMYATAAVGTRSGIVDWRAGYADALRSWSPHARWNAEAFRRHGQAGGELEIEYKRTGGYGAAMFFADPSALRPRLRLSLRAIALRDDRYLRDDVVWERGQLIAATAHARAGIVIGTGSVLGAVRVDLDAPGSAWEYGRTFAELRGSMRAPAGAVLSVRTAAGRISGDAPAQTELYLAQASPWERFGTRWFRADNILDKLDIADRTLIPGGGNVIAARPGQRGERLAAVNASLTRGFFELFADAGDVWNSDRDIDVDRWTADAGVGVRIGLPGTLGPIDFARYSVYLRAPLWVRDPAAPERNGFDWRLRVVIGGKWGEM